MVVSKGDETRRAILTDALAQASVTGLDGLTIGSLAKKTGLSKSGLYAHFASKEELQVRVIDEARERFVEVVVTPAFRAARGEPRLRALFERWLEWEDLAALPGGCPFIAASTELDDKPGPARDRLVETQRDWEDTLAGAARIAVEKGHLQADLDVAQFTYELWAMMLGFHWYSRLLDRGDAKARLRVAFEALLERARPEPAA